MQKLRLLIVPVAALAAPLCAVGSDRAALLVANVDYGEHQVDHASGRTMRSELAKLGFAVEARSNLPQKELESALHAFLKSTPTNGIAVIHFTGLGITARSGQKKERTVSIQGAGPAKDEREVQRQDYEIGKRFFQAFEKDAGARTLHFVFDLPTSHPVSENLNVPGENELAEVAAPAGVALHRSLEKALAAIRKELPREKRSFVTSARSTEGTRPGQRWVNGIGMVLTWCPPGAFTMGLESERDAKPVKASISRGFWIGTYELTQREYRAIRGKDPNAGRVLSHRNAPAVNFGNGSPELARKLTERERKAGRLGADWEYAVPTEAQWEYACRAGTTTRFSFGDDPRQLHLHGNFAEGALYGDDPAYHYAATSVSDGVGATPALVGTYRPNPWGVHDMHGNVSEWCRDYHFPELPGGTDPFPAKEQKEGEKVIRGGAWCSLPKYCQSGFRNSSAISNNAEKLAFLGVRLVLQRTR